MSRNLKLFLGATVIFYLIGAINDALGMYIMAAAALAVILACFFLTRLLIRGVEVGIELQGTRSRPGGQMLALASVYNAGRITRSGMSLALDVVNETVPAATRSYDFLLPPLPARSRTMFELTLACQARGVHRISGVRIVSSDPLGMYRRWRPCPCTPTFLGLPRVCTVPDLCAWELLSPEGRRAARIVRRTGGEFESIRPHVPGDDLRHVHWKITAHTGELAVRDYRQRPEAEISVWLDLWAGNHPVSAVDGPTEVAVCLAATLLVLFARGDDLLSLAGQGLSPDLALPSRGEAYLDRALVELAQATPSEGLTFTEFCEERLRISPRLANLFVITPAAEPALPDVLAAAAQRGARVTVYLVGGEPTAGSPHLPERLLAEAHERMAWRLQAAGVRALQVPTLGHIWLAILGTQGEAASASAVV